MSLPMVGSIIPGVPVPVRTRLATFPDHSLEPRIKRRSRVVDPVTSFPGMNQQHGADHPIIQQLHQLMSAGGPQAAHGKMGQYPAQPAMREGYAAMKENRDWRHNL